MSYTRRVRFGAAAAALALLTVAGCSGEEEATPSDPGSSSTEAEAPSGTITVLTNRTDIVDTVFQDYKTTFEEMYPEVTVEFQALTDYAGEVKTRMSTTDYGDVLLLPSSIEASDYPDFYEPLGSVEELGEKYRFIGAAELDGTVYGIPTFGNANGMVYNKDVFVQAGITDLPTTPDELIEDLEAIKANTEAIPMYTNYKDGWPLSWPQGLVGTVSADPDALVKMAEDKTPWDEGKEKAVVDSLLFDIVAAGLTEDDPTTTNWENSKNLLATGEIAMMPLGSWAVPQMQEAAEKAGGDPGSIGFMPAPFQVDGDFHSPTGSDYTIGINVNSEHKAAARAWIDFFVEDSGFNEFAGGLPTLKDEPAPAQLKEFEDSGVEYIEMTPAPMINAVDGEAEIGVGEPDYYRELVDAARGASGKSKDEIFASLNEKWSAAVEAEG